ncbi:MAG: hypothetical protein HC842_04650 [Cytophagales bacterium]|nr:hypothetical protein [Cytophagales bacterium]
MIRILLTAFGLFLGFIGWSQTTYYSVSTGNWNSAAVWDTDPAGAGGDGIPAEADSVVIQLGTTVTIPNNYGTAAHPGGACVTGVPTAAGADNFRNDGGVLIQTGGALVFTTSGSDHFILTGQNRILGSLTVGNRLYNYGELVVESGATFSLGNDLALGLSSSTMINQALDLAAGDDIYLLGTGATLCGSGSISLGTAADQLIQEYCGANKEDQFCLGFRFLMMALPEIPPRAPTPHYPCILSTGRQ